MFKLHEHTMQFPRQQKAYYNYHCIKNGGRQLRKIIPKLDEKHDHRFCPCMMLCKSASCLVLCLVFVSCYAFYWGVNLIELSQAYFQRNLHRILAMLWLEFIATTWIKERVHFKKKSNHNPSKSKAAAATTTKESFLTPERKLVDCFNSALRTKLVDYFNSALRRTVDNAQQIWTMTFRSPNQKCNELFHGKDICKSYPWVSDHVVNVWW